MKADNKWDVEVFIGSNHITTITVKAETPTAASDEAIKNFNVKVKKNYK